MSKAVLPLLLTPGGQTGGCWDRTMMQGGGVVAATAECEIKQKKSAVSARLCYELRLRSATMIALVQTMTQSTACHI